MRTQDLRRALVYIAFFLFPSWGSEMQDKDCPVRILTAFADELESGKLVRFCDSDRLLLILGRRSLASIRGTAIVSFQSWDGDR